MSEQEALDFISQLSLKTDEKPRLVPFQKTTTTPQSPLQPPPSQSKPPTDFKFKAPERKAFVPRHLPAGFTSTSRPPTRSPTSQPADPNQPSTASPQPLVPQQILKQIPLQAPTQTPPSQKPSASKDAKETNVQDQWWGSILSTAQAGLNQAKTLAGTAAQSLQDSKTYHDLVQGDIGGFMGKMGDTIVPGGSGGVRCCVWFCPGVQTSISERLTRTLKQATRQEWGMFATTVQTVDTEVVMCASLEEAIKTSEETMERLQRLASGQIQEGLQSLFTIQPFQTTLKTSLGLTQHTQFYCSVLIDGAGKEGIMEARCVSQSVGVRGEEWEMEMHGRVLESTVMDLVSEVAHFQ